MLFLLLIYCRKRANSQTAVEDYHRQRQRVEEQRRLEKQMKKQKFMKKYKALIEKLMPKNKYKHYVKKYPLLE